MSTEMENTSQSNIDIEVQIQRLSGREKIIGRSKWLSLWQDFYRGDYGLLHYNVKTANGTYVQLTKKTLNISKKVCSDLANYVLNEKCQIVVPDAAQKTLNTILKRTHFWSKTNQNYEQAMALSLGAWVEGIEGLQVDEDGYKVGNGKLKVRFVNATKIYPITAIDDKIVECAFVSNQTTHYNIEMHLIDEKTGNYIVKVAKLSPDYSTVLENDMKTFKTNSPIPLFQLVYPNLANNLDLNSPLPISLYANEIDKIVALDEKYDDEDIEFKNGKKRIFVNARLWKVNEEGGEVEKTFDENDTVFYQMEFDNNDKPMIETSADPLRDESYIRAINSDLNLISQGIGFGRNYYNIQELTETSKTATEVKAMNAELMDTIHKHELVVYDALIDFVKAVQYLSNEFTDTPLGQFKEEEIDVKFDDSVFEDKDSEQRRDKENVETGLSDIIEYRMKWMGETEDDAKAYVWTHLRYKLINDNLQALTTGALPPKQFVDICFGDKEEKEKNEIIEYVDKKLKLSDPDNWDDFGNEDEVTE